jgi:hypothetical protein
MSNRNNIRLLLVPIAPTSLLQVAFSSVVEPQTATAANLFRGRRQPLPPFGLVTFGDQ